MECLSLICNIIFFLSDIESIFFKEIHVNNALYCYTCIYSVYQKLKEKEKYLAKLTHKLQDVKQQNQQQHAFRKTTG